MKNRIYFPAILLIITFTTFAQVPSWQWAKSAGGVYPDFGYSVAVDANGNSYVTGSFQSPSILFGTTTLTNSGSANSYIVKYDPSGNVLWARSPLAKGSRPGNASANSIVIDAVGNLYITGTFYSDTLVFGNSILINAGCRPGGLCDFDFFIAKYDPSGNVLWAKRAGGTYYEEGRSIAVDNGYVFATGIFKSDSLIFGTTMLNNPQGASGYSDIFIVKYDTSGNLIWAKSAGGNKNDYGNAIKVDAKGNTYLSGYFTSNTIYFGNDSLTNPATPNPHLFVVKYDASGNTLWARTTGGQPNDMASGIALDAKANVYITGSFSSPSISFDTTTLTKYANLWADVFIVKYDSTGKVVWAKAGGGLLDDVGKSIVVDAAGNSFLTGYFASSSAQFGSATLTNPVAGNNDIFVVAHDSSGKVIWARSAGGNGFDAGNGIALDANKNIYVTGMFNSLSIDFGSNNLTNSPGVYDVFLAKLNSHTGIAEANKYYNAINIFPNPGNGQINITSSYTIDAIAITNLLGQIIYQSKPNERNIFLKLEHDGIYFVTVSSNKQTTTKKVVIQQ